nr:MAG TPA: hypothetical protein [Caudoviricetes sp.]
MLVLHHDIACYVPFKASGWVTVLFFADYS